MSCGHHRHHRCPGEKDLFGDLCRSIGERVVVIIRGDGPNGAFRGTLADVRDCVIRLVLTRETDAIPAGEIVSIPICEIAAFSRVR